MLGLDLVTTDGKGAKKIIEWTNGQSLNNQETNLTRCGLAGCHLAILKFSYL